MKLCGSDECKRKAAAERSRRARERKRNPVPEAVPETGTVEAPWDQEYRCLCAAWMDAYLLAGFAHDRAEAVAWIEAQGYDGHAPLVCPALKAS